MGDAQRDVVIIEGVRTPFAKSGTALKDIHAAELGAISVRELIAKTNLDIHQIDEVIIGNTANPSDTANIARVIALNSAIPLSVPAFCVHRNCASALEAITSAYERIQSGSSNVLIAGGTENMSQLPLLFTQRFANLFGEFAFAKSLTLKLLALKKLRLSDLKPRISIMEGLRDPFSGLMMGDTAELLAREFNIDRNSQDQFALESHQKAVAAQKSGRLDPEIVPVFVAPRFEKIIQKDIGPREEQSIEALKKMKPYFDRRNGTVTVANSCPITDGAASVLMMSRRKAQDLGHKPLARIVSYAFRGLQPERMGLGPVFATAVALKKAHLPMSAIELVELNEAFASQVLACLKAFASDSFAQKELGLSTKVGEIDPKILNVNGGAIALGHPVGATGTRIVLTLAKEMKRRKIKYGLATLCIGGGQGGAIILENEEN